MKRCGFTYGGAGENEKMILKIAQEQLICPLQNILGHQGHVIGTRTTNSLDLDSHSPPDDHLSRTLDATFVDPMGEFLKELGLKLKPLVVAMKLHRSH